MATDLIDTSSGPGYLERGGHGVEFYAYDAQITGRVANFVAPAFGTGEAVIIIATSEHRVALEQELAARGCDVAAARKSGTYLALDAATMLAKLLVDAMPTAPRFDAVIGAAIRSTLAGGATHVRAYGEMVALLWLAGRPDAAIALEELWNDLARDTSFTLLCGYPVTAFRPAHAEAIAAVGRAHTQIAPIRPLLRPSGA